MHVVLGRVREPVSEGIAAQIPGECVRAAGGADTWMTAVVTPPSSPTMTVPVNPARPSSPRTTRRTASRRRAGLKTFPIAVIGSSSRRQTSLGAAGGSDTRTVGVVAQVVGTLQSTRARYPRRLGRNVHGGRDLPAVRRIRALEV